MFREVTMIELKEVLRLWSKGLPKKRVAAQLGLDLKTVRRYVKAATAAGLRADRDPISDEQVRDVLLALHPVGGRPRGDGWDLVYRAARVDPALVGWRRPPHQDSQTARSPGRADRLSHANGRFSGVG